MKRCFLNDLLFGGLMGCGLCICLIAGVLQSSDGGMIGRTLREADKVLRDESIQWVIYVSGCLYFIVFVFFGRRCKKVSSLLFRGEEEPKRSSLQNALVKAWTYLSSAQFILVLMFAIAAVGYFLDYKGASQSRQAIGLLGGALLGFCGARLVKWRYQNDRFGEGSRITADVFIIVLLGFSMYHPEIPNVFFYRNQVRWSGVWDYPNTYGVLMGLGVVLAIGMAVYSFQHISGAGKWASFKAAFYVSAAGIMGFGLIKSYSRGAWLGAAFAIFYLTLPLIRSYYRSAFQQLQQAKRISMLEIDCKYIFVNGLSLTTLLIAGAVVCFWYAQQTELPHLRRIVSLSNKNDFSCRNRAAAWKGALLMMKDQPGQGFRWSRSETIYGQLYAPENIKESTPFQLNDYFYLGATLGIPACGCFFAYVWLCLLQGPARKTERGQEFKGTCHAGAIVLLIAFWFDGGLFKLAIAPPFWLLLDVGRSEAVDGG